MQRVCVWINGLSNARECVATVTTSRVRNSFCLVSPFFLFFFLKNHNNTTQPTPQKSKKWPDRASVADFETRMPKEERLWGRKKKKSRYRRNTKTDKNRKHVEESWREYPHRTSFIILLEYITLLSLSLAYFCISLALLKLIIHSLFLITNDRYSW